VRLVRLVRLVRRAGGAHDAVDADPGQVTLGGGELAMRRAIWSAPDTGRGVRLGAAGPAALAGAIQA